MLAGALADSDVFQVTYPLLLIPVATVFAALYADWRAKHAPLPPSGTTMSVTQVLQIHHHHHARRTVAPKRKAKRASRTWTQEEIVVVGIGVLVAVAVLSFLIARGFAEARDELLFGLLTLASINFGTALGAFVALRRYAWFDRSWRWPAAACAFVAVVGGIDVYLLLHPAFATGDYEQVFRSYLHERSIFEGAFSDVDANAFLAFQGLASLLALLVLGVSLILVVGVWAAIEESVGLRPSFPRRAARWLVSHYADKRWASAMLMLLVVFSATLCAGWYYNGFKAIQARWDHDGPAVSSLGARAGSKKVRVRMTISEPVRVDVTVKRGAARSGGRATFELRPGSHHVSLYGRADRGIMRRGRYTVVIVIRDEAGNATPHRRFLRID
jgi:MFS family permease